MANSAVIIEVPAAQPVVGVWRDRYDPIAKVGIPPHVTVLFPFHRPELLDDARLATIAGIAADTEPFDFELAELHEFDASGVLWLRPVPAGQFIAITRRLVRAFPECPPYEGRHKDERPHLTIAHPDGFDGRDVADVRAEVEHDVAPRLPFAARATALSVFGSDDDTTWRRVASFPLGGALT